MTRKPKRQTPKSAEIMHSGDDDMSSTSGSRKGFTKVVTTAFIGLLIASFALWGVADGFGTVQNRILVEVGDQTITERQFEFEWRSNLTRIRREMGRNPTQEEIQAGQLQQSVIANLVQRAALDAEANSLNLAVPDEVLAQRLAEQSAFRGEDGKFSRAAFSSAIRRSGLNEAIFLERIKSEIKADQLVTNALIGISNFPVDLLYASLTQSRDIATITIDAVPITLEMPTDEGLKLVWNNFASLWTAPQYRKIDAIDLSAITLASQEEISDTDARSWFEENRDTFAVQEQRAIRQIVVNEISEAEQLVTDLRSGTLSWAQALQRYDILPEDSDLGLTLPSGILNPALRAAAFASTATGVIDAVETPVGSVVAEVTEIIPQSNPTFEEIANTVRSRIRQERGLDRLWELQEIVDSSLASGIPIAEIAADIGVEIIRVPFVDSTGEVMSPSHPKFDQQAGDNASPETAQIALEQLGEEVLVQAFNQRDESFVAEALARDNDTRLTWWRVSDVIDPEVLPLEEVRNEVSAKWQSEKVRTAAQRAGEAALKKAETAISFDSLASTLNADVQRITDVTISYTNPSLSRELIQDVISARAGETVLGWNADESQAILARVETIHESDFDPSSQAAVSLSLQTSRGFHQDMLREYIAALLVKYPPRYNEAALAEVSAYYNSEG